MLAVLQSAIEDYQKYALARDKRGKELFEQAEEWIMETGSNAFFSFENICAHLQLAPDYVRRGFLGWKAAQIDGTLADKNHKPGARQPSAVRPSTSMR